MNSTSKYWAPSSPSLTSLMAVENPSRQPMTPQLHRQLMLSKISRLVKQAGPQQAQAALEMSVEHLPEMAGIAAAANPEHWPAAILNSDLMQQHLNQIDWSKQAPLADRMMVVELLKEQSLESLLEAL